MGSIGGLVLDFLCKSGFKNFDIYDPDTMGVENNPRHVLGINKDEMGVYKTDHLSKHYSSLFPMVKITPHTQTVLYSKLKINKGDIVINTTGGPINRILLNGYNIYTNNNDISFTYVDMFTEPFGLAVHSIVTN